MRIGGLWARARPVMAVAARPEPNAPSVARRVMDCVMVRPPFIVSAGNKNSGLDQCVDFGARIAVLAENGDAVFALGRRDGARSAVNERWHADNVGQRH